jgi:ribose transport system substrate-binding protein
MKKVFAVLLSLVLVCSFAFANGQSEGSSAGSTKKPLIGVSIWSSTDTLGSQCKLILDAAAKALDVDIMYVDQGHISEQVTASAETLCAAGCDGMIICNSASAEMTSVINTCTQNKVYCAQFFRIINKDDNPNEYALACKSPYYVGAVHENEIDNGKNLVRILCEKGCRNIALEAWEAGDATFLLRWKGYKAGIEDWNAKHPTDKAVLLDPQYGGTTSDTGRATAEAIINANPTIDALIVAGGGGDTLVGALAAIESMGKKGKINVVSTDFLADLDKQLATGGMAAESGGHYCDPLFAFMLVYNAIKGNYKVATDSFYEVNFPYLYVASSDDYAAYAKYFVDDLPYNADELRAMATLSEGDLVKKAASLSIEDVKSRRK